jgi:shikimate dehydrogenase
VSPLQSGTSASPSAASSARISGKTRLVGVIGWPIEHSVSPPMHNAAFDALGMDWRYLAFAVRPDDLPDAIAGVRALGLRGINATVPHKEHLLALMDRLTPAARTIGAANTVIVSDEGLTGHNTDAAGFLRALREAGFEPDGCRALVLGAGGAARAVVYALADVGAHVTILNRTEARAHALAEEFAHVHPEVEPRSGPLTANAVRREAKGVDLVVNATTLGMWPKVELSPWPEEVAYPGHAFCFDLVYNPRETQLMRQARAAGAGASDGLGMLVHQGAEAFGLWTGTEPPIDTMYAACTAVLGGH